MLALANTIIKLWLTEGSTAVRRNH